MCCIDEIKSVIGHFLVFMVKILEHEQNDIFLTKDASLSKKYLFAQEKIFTYKVVCSMKMVAWFSKSSVGIQLQVCLVFQEISRGKFLLWDFTSFQIFTISVFDLNFSTLTYYYLFQGKFQDLSRTKWGKAFSSIYYLFISFFQGKCWVAFSSIFNNLFPFSRKGFKILVQGPKW